MRAFFNFALLSALATAGHASPPTANVELSNFKFAPTAIRLHAGAPVVLHLANVGGSNHNFSAPQFFAAAKLDPQSASLIHDEAVEVRGHSAVDIALVPGAGQFPVKCTHTLHSSFGMKGSITVRP